MTNIELKPDFILIVPKEEDVALFVVDMRSGAPVHQVVSLKTAQERIFVALLQGYTVHSEEETNHTRIYITNGEAIAIAREAFQKEYLK